MTPRWLVCAALAIGCVKPGAQGAGAPIVISAARIYTGDLERPLAEALVLRNGQVELVGTRAAALEHAGPGATVEHFENATIVPGLVDAHAHLAGLGRSLAITSLLAAKSEAEAVERLAAGAPSADGWRQARGWDQNDWDTKHYPTKASLDARWPTQPVFASRVDGHAAWVNSEALRRANIGADTKDPPGGRILRDAQGAATGVLVDNAMELVRAVIPPTSDDELQRQLKLALELCVRLGLTGIHDAGMDVRTFRQLQTWDALGVLPMRIYALADGQGHEAETFLGLGLFSGRMLSMRGVKLVLDGALGSRGAALAAPYDDEPSTSGHLLLTPDEFREKARAFDGRGFQVAVHAIGDKANSVAIDTLGALSTANAGRRHRVEHAQILSPLDVHRFAQFGLIASMQPTHATSDMPWAEARVGPSRLTLAYAWRSLLDAKAHLAFGSDFPVESPDPLLGLYAARTRSDVDGQPPGGWTPAQKLTGAEALAAFTQGSAYASFAETRRGQLKTGFDADFVVLDVDVVEGPPAQLLKGKALATFVAGVDVYRPH